MTLRNRVLPLVVLFGLGCGSSNSTPAPSPFPSTSRVSNEQAMVTTPPPSPVDAGVPVPPGSGSGPVIPPDYVFIPAGWFHPSCIHAVPKGGGVDQNGNVVLNGAIVYQHRPCQYPPIKGYQTAKASSVQMAPRPETGGTCSTSGTWNPWSEGALQCAPSGASVGWDAYQSTIYVPSSSQTPPDDGALLYYWTGISDYEGGDLSGGGLYQSVLQWGNSTYGGTYGAWSFASWYVVQGDAYPGTFYSASPGDTIGTDTYADYSFGNGAYLYYIDTEDENTGDDSTNSSVSNVALSLAEPAVFEGYDITSCSYVPDNYVDVTNIILYAGDLNWNSFDSISPSYGTFVSSGDSLPSGCGWAVGVGSYSGYGEVVTLWQ